MILVKCQRSFKISFFDPNYAFPWPQAPTPPYNAHAHRQDLFLYPILRSIDFRRTWCFDNLDISNWKYTKKLQNHKGEAFTNKSRCVTTKNCHCLKMEHDFVIRHLLVLSLSVQGVPKKTLSECCWSHSALAQSPFAGTPCVLVLIFWSFLTKTKQDQAPPSHVNGKT